MTVIHQNLTTLCLFGTLLLPACDSSSKQKPESPAEHKVQERVTKAEPRDGAERSAPPDLSQSETATKRAPEEELNVEEAGSPESAASPPEAAAPAAAAPVAAAPETKEKDSENPCADLSESTPGAKVAKLAQVLGGSGLVWTSADDVTAEDFDEDGGIAYGRLTVLKGLSHWEVAELTEGMGRNDSYRTYACYRADESLAYFERWMLSPGSNGTAEKKVAVSKDGVRGEEKWILTSFMGEPMPRSSFVDLELLDATSDPPQKLSADPRYELFVNYLK